MTTKQVELKEGCVNSCEEDYEAGWEWDDFIKQHMFLTWKFQSFIPKMGKEDPLILEIIDLHRSLDFAGILQKIREVESTGKAEDTSALRLLSWPAPTREDLSSFGEFINTCGVTHLYSIGCGTGLLEWLLLKVIQDEHQSGNFHGVTGIEVDVGWWSSPYSPPMFLPLLFVDRDGDFNCEEFFGRETDFILFCYFNNLTVFLKYLEKFRGKYLGLLGPISKTRFCAPAPLELVENPTMPREAWELVRFQPFGLGNVDHLAIYKKASSWIKTDWFKQLLYFYVYFFITYKWNVFSHYKLSSFSAVIYRHDIILN